MRPAPVGMGATRWLLSLAAVALAATVTGCGTGDTSAANVGSASDTAGGDAVGADDGQAPDRPWDDASGRPGVGVGDGPGTVGSGHDGAGDDGADGFGTVSPCEVTLACNLRGDEWSAGTLGGQPFDEVRCISTCDEPGAAGVQVELLERPAGSRARFRPDLSEREHAVLDIAGRYLIHAVAVDAAGDALCAGAPIGVQVTPASELHVQLVWDTPRDPDQDDVCLTCGADVDLHVARGGPAWWHPVDDVFFLNRAPDWGTADVRGDDPRLDVDDTDGAGPENINFDVLGADRVGVAVHYFDDNGWGESFATLRVYLYGEMLFEVRDRRMVEDEFWYVGDFDPTTETFATRDVTWLENRNR